MPANASTLRRNIYRLLDQVLASGKPLAIVRKGRHLKVVPDIPGGDRLSRLVAHPCIAGDPEDLVRIDWSDEWKGDKCL